MTRKLQNLEQLLDHLAGLTDGREEVSLRDVVSSIGSRSFGPLLMVIGIALLSPLSGVPGMASTMAVLVLLMAVQMLCGRTQFWLPGFLLNRSVSCKRLLKAIYKIKPAAKKVDGVLRPRLTALVTNGASYVIAALCVLIGLCMPLMEMVPFSASAAGLALAAFGLSLVVQDGLLVIFAITWVVATFVLVVVNIL